MEESGRPAGWYTVEGEDGFTRFRYFADGRWTETTVERALAESDAAQVQSRLSTMNWLGLDLCQAIDDVKLVVDVEYREDRASSSGYHVALPFRVKGSEAAARLRSLGLRARDELGDRGLDDLVVVVGMFVGRVDAPRSADLLRGEDWYLAL